MHLRRVCTVAAATAVAVAGTAAEPAAAVAAAARSAACASRLAAVHRTQPSVRRRGRCRFVAVLPVVHRLEPAELSSGFSPVWVPPAPHSGRRPAVTHLQDAATAALAVDAAVTTTVTTAVAATIAAAVATANTAAVATAVAAAVAAPVAAAEPTATESAATKPAAADAVRLRCQRPKRWRMLVVPARF